MKRTLLKYRVFRKAREIIKRCKFETLCVIYDVRYIYRNISRLKSNINQNCILVCSINFFEKKQWQVASQAELWHKFIADNNVLLCGSFISYFLFGRYSKNVVSLEPRYNAPTIKFSLKHTKVIVFVSDSHSKEWLNRSIKKNNITDILTPYKHTLLSTGYVSNLSEKNVHSFPWAISDSIIDNIDIKSSRNDVLGFGITGSEVYDLREWSFNTGELVSFNYAGSGNKKYSGSDFFHWLREFDACVVAMSTIPLYNYTVAKYFEVPSQGLLLFTFPSEDLEVFGFKDGVNCIYVDKNNFFEKLRAFKKKPEAFIEIRQNGLDLIKEQHTITHRAKFLEQLIK